MTESGSPAKQRRNKEAGPIARWLLPSIGSFCLLLVLYLLVVSSWRFLLDSDTGWHIRTGEMILAERAVPRVDPFSHTMAGRPWFAWEWLTDVLMALLHGWRGLAGVVGGAILTLLAAYAALYQLTLRRGSDPLIACVLTVFGALCGIVHWLARPHLLSIVLMIGWYALFERYRRTRTRAIFLTPILIALWANLHGAFVSTFVVTAVYAIGESIEFALRREWSRVKPVLATYFSVGLLSVLAAMATPYGYRLYGHLWRYLTDRELLASIQEFQSPNFHSTDGKLIEILLVLGAIAAANALRKGRVVETGLLLLWGHMTLQSERHVTLAVVFLVPIIGEQISSLVSELIDRYSIGTETPARALRAARGWYRGTLAINRQLTGAFVYAAVIIFVIVLTGSRWADRLLSPRFNPRRFPVAAVEFVKKNMPDGRMYSHDQFGGFLIYSLYPRTRVFVDGRSDFYRQGTVLDDMDSIAFVKPRWQELLDRHGIEWMILRNREPLALIAIMSGKWVSIYDDQVAQILVRKGAPPNK
ncbi:MAG: hypothetical protein AB7H86_12595 [Blastocatellales bacterium]